MQNGGMGWGGAKPTTYDITTVICNKTSIHDILFFKQEQSKLM